MSFDIAIVGLSCRFPKAPDKAGFWSLLSEGRSTVQRLTPNVAAVDGMPAQLVAADNYIPSASILDNIESFDAGFFGIPAREAVVLDPQHRLFLECAWEALEDAGYDPARPGAADVGVFAGASLNSYLINNLACDPRFLSTSSGFLSLISNEKDYLASRVAYKLNLHGPAITVQTACSTSLVAVHLAIQSLLLGECDVALAGGVSVKVPQRLGYLHQEGMPFSADGRCRPFDAGGTGTIFGSGAGVVVLRPREAAEAAGDDIYAIIRASACNNDGNRKVGFTAPSTDGQAAVIRRAVLTADVNPAEVSYVEAHGTATPLGDPIEVAALGEVYGLPRREPCRLGSVKSNIGHMETAAGVTGLIKTVLMLKAGRLVPSLGFETPNSHIDFTSAGLTVQTRCEDWPNHARQPRLAAVSSFGMGGTNVHLILEEATPVAQQILTRRRSNIVLLSAKSEKALAAAAQDLDRWLEARPDVDLAHVAAWQQTRRPHLRVRQAVVAADAQQAQRCLSGTVDEQVFVSLMADKQPETTFLYCGAGAQYPGMMGGLLEDEPIFRSAVATCAELFRPIINEDLHRYLNPAARGNAALAQRMQKPDIMFPALFTVQHAMGELLADWGVHPALVIGHSNGDYAAAVRAGALDLETAVSLVGARSMLMMRMKPGGMLAVCADPQRVTELAASLGLSIGAFNARNNVVLSGETAKLREAEIILKERMKLGCRRVPVETALHSHLSHEIAQDFAGVLASKSFSAPRIAWISAAIGGFMDPARAPGVAHWVNHLCQPVRFSDAAATLLALPGPRTVIDLGPDRLAGNLLRQNFTGSGPSIVHASHGCSETTPDSLTLLGALAKFWTLGGNPDWTRFQGGAVIPRLDLPHYPWQRQRYWIDPPQGERQAAHIDMQFAVGNSDPETSSEGDRAELMTPPQAAQSETEKRLLALWQAFLGLKDIGTADDFIELGGTSLLATELVAAIRREFNLALELGTFLELRTIGTLAKQLEEMEAAEEERRLQEAMAEIAGKSEAELRALVEMN